ncbi:hypothetical protein ACLOJK_031428 [Asimina triloba]
MQMRWVKNAGVARVASTPAFLAKVSARAPSQIKDTLSSQRDGKPKNQTTTTQHKLRKHSTTPPPPPPQSYHQPSYYFPNSPHPPPPKPPTPTSPTPHLANPKENPGEDPPGSLLPPLPLPSSFLPPSLLAAAAVPPSLPLGRITHLPPTTLPPLIPPPPPSFDRCRFTASATDIIIDVDSKGSFAKKYDQFDAFDSISEIELPPIVTKPPKFDGFTLDVTNNEMEPVEVPEDYVELEEKSARSRPVSMKILKDGTSKSPVPVQDRSPAVRRSSVSASQGLRIRSNSPRIASKKIQSYSRKSVSMSSSKNRRKGLSESFAVVKSSFDPQRDFRDSMVEMIVENNIRASKDLEDLLACYLSLNSDEYHDTIVKVFEQIWFDLTDIRL